MIESQRCAELVYSRAGWHGTPQCERTGKLFEDGKWWCRTHAPSSVAARRAEREAKWRRESDRRDAVLLRRRQYDDLCDDVFALLRRVHRAGWFRDEHLTDFNALRDRLVTLDAEQAKAGAEA